MQRAGAVHVDRWPLQVVRNSGDAAVHCTIALLQTAEGDKVLGAGEESLKG